MPSCTSFRHNRLGHLHSMAWEFLETMVVFTIVRAMIPWHLASYCECHWRSGMLAVHLRVLLAFVVRVAERSMALQLIDSFNGIFHDL